ncbi:MAG: rod shape-determining protein [Legionellales bacterium]|nr:rod shape-determining protein [Legionellales bacterium]
MMSPIGLSIDLGTANTLIYLPGHGIVLNEPSVAAIKKNLTTRPEICAVGINAKKMEGRTPGHIKAIRPLKDGVIADFYVTEKMLHYFMAKLKKQKFFFFSPRVVVCVPYGATQVERRAIKESILNAGGKEVYLIDEPMAAAMGANLPVESPKGSMIVDIGGGTTEVAILSLNGIVYAKSVRIGGDRFDECIVSHIKKKFGILIGLATAEMLKKQIGTAFPSSKVETMDICGRNVAEGIPKLVTVNSNDILESLQEPLSGMVTAIRGALESAPPELSSDIAEQGMTLTGGGALLASLDKLIHEETGLPVYIADDPLTCVAHGGGKMIDLIKTIGERHFDEVE